MHGQMEMKQSNMDYPPDALSEKKGKNWNSMTVATQEFVSWSLFDRPCSPTFADLPTQSLVSCHARLIGISSAFPSKFDCKLPLSMLDYLTRYLRKLLPDPRSRVASAIVALLAIALSLYWLVSTIQNKWIEGRRNPQQIVTFDQAESLPSFFGLGFDDSTVQQKPTESFFKVLPAWSEHHARCAWLCAGDMMFFTTSNRALCIYVFHSVPRKDIFSGHCAYWFQLRSVRSR
jgi:hypothetical protein